MSVRSFTRRARRPYRLGWFGVATGLFALAGTVIPVSMIIVILSIPGPLVQNVILVGSVLPSFGMPGGQPFEGSG
jgi:hypothetical protein